MTPTQGTVKAATTPHKDVKSAAENTTPLLEDQAVVTYVTLPPDGGWGWVVVAASFCCSFCNDGIINTAGLFIGRIDEDLGVSKTSVSLMGSTLSGFSLLIGPLVSALTNRYGFQMVAVLGALGAGVGFVACSQGDSILFLWLAYGVVAGTGFGLNYLPSVISIGFYFERWRSLATSIAACGAGFGTILLAPIMSYLLDNYGWRFTILVQAGMMLGVAFFSLAFRPLEPIQVTVPSDEDSDVNSTEDNTNNNLGILTSESIKKDGSRISVNTEVNITITAPSGISKFLKAAHNDKYATVHDVLSSNHRNIRSIFNESETSVNQTSGTENNTSARDVAAIKENRLRVKNDPNRLSISSDNSDDQHKDVEGSQERIDNLLTKHLTTNNKRRRSGFMRLMDSGAISEVRHVRKHSSFMVQPPRQSTTPSECGLKALSNRRTSVKNDPNRLSICSNNSDDQHNDLDGSQGRIDNILTKHLTIKNNRRRSSFIRLMDAGAISEVSHVRKHSTFMLQSPRLSISPSECGLKVLSSRRVSVSSGVRPLYKEDIFYQANLKRLPQYSSKISKLDYAMTVTHLPTVNDVLEEETSRCILCPEAVRRTLATMLDLSLLTSPSFFLLCFSGFLTNMGFYIPYMYLESRIKDGGLDPSLGKWLISTIGVSNTIGRAMCGVVSSLPNMSAMFVNNVMLTVGGLATIFSGLYMTVAYQFTYAFIFGFSVSAFSALRSILTVDLIGLEKLTNGFGIMILYQGVSAGIGPPMAGLIMEWTQSYDVMFVLTGFLILLSAVMCYPLNRVNRWEKTQQLKKQAKAALDIQIA